MFKIIQGTKLYELVIEQIESLILRGVYKKGDMLPSEKDLVASTGVSRITVREALRLLAGAGIIETKHGKGSQVIIDGIDLARQKTELFKNYKECFNQAVKVRLLIEPEIARHAAAVAKPLDIERICAAVCEEPLSSGRPAWSHETAAANFHTAIVETTGIPYLIDFLGKILDTEMLPKGSTLIPPIMQREIFSQFNEQHRKIAEAIREHDGEFAYFYMKEHTLFVEQVFQSYFADMACPAKEPA